MGGGPGSGDGKILDIRTADLKSAAPVFSEHSGKLREALSELTTTLDGLGAPWGADDQGKAFGESYKPARTKVENATKILVAGLASIHEAMVDMSDGHVENDKLIAGMFSKKGVQGSQGSQDSQGSQGGGSGKAGK
ncbi:WXG100 family type VII secretion target [Streptomyces aureoversilis]|uniref:WXG100 family type VII secretion target n=1 Tax=Streptomyces aureoversilis TaxID=67277 RepID=A0ABW0A5N8_9ACTN